MTETEAWIATEATITGCRFQFARLNTFTLGIQTGEKFRVTFDYYAHGRLYSDEFQSPVAIPQNTRIPLTYNPLHPEQNSRSSGPMSRPGVILSSRSASLVASCCRCFGWLLFAAVTRTAYSSTWING